MYSINFTEQQLSVIAQALGDQPYKVAAPLIMEIQRQVNAIIEARRADNEKEQGGHEP